MPHNNHGGARTSFAILFLFFISNLSSCVSAACFEEVTPWTRRLPARAGLFWSDLLAEISSKVALIGEDPEFENVSFSASATTLKETFWSHHHTAHRLNETRTGANPVTGDSFYRVASITKMFTTTAILQLHAARKLNLEDSVLKYLPKLGGHMAWEDITIRMLVGQISGLGRDWSQGDLTKGVPNMIEKGFPPPTRKHLPECYEHNDFFTACNETDLYEMLPHQRPVFAPNQVSSYSNAAFEILGLVIEAASKTSYENYVTENILKSWDILSGATFETPDDSTSVLPIDKSWFFNVHIGIHDAAGGLYASTNGLDAYLRHMMLKADSHELGGPAVNVFMPESYSFGSSSAYGLTWEIFRTNKMLDNQRPVTFFTKGGGHPGYITIIMAVPEYGLGMTVLCAGDKAGKALTRVREVVAKEIVEAADEVVSRELRRKYTGLYTFDVLLKDDEPVEAMTLNSSLTLAHDAVQGLYIQGWVSNGSDMLTVLDEIFTPDNLGAITHRLVATGLERHHESGREGQIWRGVPIMKQQVSSFWADFCVNDVDGLHFDGKPFLEFVFYDDGDVVEIPSFRVRLRRERVDGGDIVDSMKAEKPELLLQIQG